MRRLFALALLFTPIAALAANISATIDGKIVVFKDVSSTAWYASHIKQAANAGIVSGYRNANARITVYFGPSDTVTVAQALKMAVQGAEHDIASFPPATPGADHWVDQYVGVALGANFPHIFADPVSFDRPATRGEVAQLVADAFRVRAFDIAYTDPVHGDYTDVPNNYPYAGGIEVLTGDDVMVGDDRSVHCAASATCRKTTFRPDEPLNRAEAAKIIMTARAKYGAPERGVTAETLDKND